MGWELWSKVSLRQPIGSVRILYEAWADYYSYLLYRKTTKSNPCEKACQNYHQHLSRSISSSPTTQHPPPLVNYSSSPTTQHPPPSSTIHHHLPLNTPHPTIFLVLSTHKPQRLQGRDDGGLAQSHRLKRPYATDGSGGEESDVGPLPACRRTHSQGNPSGRYGTMPSDKTYRKMRYGPQVAGLLSSARSVPTPRWIPVHRQYRHRWAHAPAYIAIDSNLVQAV